MSARIFGTALLVVLFSPAFLFAATCPQITRSLQLDDKGADVAALQAFLKEKELLGSVPLSSYYGAETQAAVQVYQAGLGIITSGSPAKTGWGVVGPATRAALAACKVPAKKLAPAPVSRPTLVYPSTSVSAGNTGIAPSSLRTLSFGMTGSDVVALQQQLVKKNLLTPDQATGYFGPATLRAVQKFQIANNIVSSGSPVTTGFGAVGARTRGALSQNAVSNSGLPSPTILPNQNIGPVTATGANAQGTSVIAQADTTDGVPKCNYAITPMPTAACSSGWEKSFDAAGCHNGWQCTPKAAPVVLPVAPRTLSCTFNGTVVANGMAVTAYQSSFASAGQCKLENRLCINGVLSGSYTSRSCTSGTVSACTLDGLTVPNGSGVTAYQSSYVPAGQTCASQTRVCIGGVLNGSYSYASCSVGAVSACTFNGQTMGHGASVTAYQASAVASGQICVSESRVCSNGTLTGSYAYGTCAVVQGQACLFNGQSVADGSTVTAYQTASVAPGQTCTAQMRTCTAGSLSGSYTQSSCTVNVAQACSFNNQSVAHGASVTAYQSKSVAYGQTCPQQSRVCSDGSLSGTYTYASCDVDGPSGCTLNGATVAHGASRTFYSDAAVAFGGSCTSVAQSRSCTNGTLSGDAAYQHSTCSVGQANACAFNGQSVAHGASVNAYPTATVPYGQTCAPQSRVCSNGSLSGTHQYPTCTAAAPSSCQFNGQSVAHGASVNAYQTSSVPAGQTCAQQSRSCSDGSLSGSYVYAACSVDAPVCTPEAAQTRVLSCQAGQTGSINQSRTSSCPGPTWSEWTTTSGSCTAIATRRNTSHPGVFQVLVDTNQLKSDEASQASAFAADGVYVLSHNSAYFGGTINWPATLSALNADIWTVTEDDPGSTYEVDFVSNSIGRMVDGAMMYIEDGLGTPINDAQIAQYSAHVVPGFGPVGARLLAHTRTFGVGDSRRDQMMHAVQNANVSGGVFEFSSRYASEPNDPGKFAEGCRYILSLGKKCYLLMPAGDGGSHSGNYLADIQKMLVYLGKSGGILNNQNTNIVLAVYQRLDNTQHFLGNDNTSIQAVVNFLNSYRSQQPNEQGRAPMGALDQADCSSGIAGWTMDPDAPNGANQAHLYIDGTFIAGTAANLYRGDLCSAIGSCNHGYSFSIPAQYRNGASHTVGVYGLDLLSEAVPATLFAQRTFTCTAAQNTDSFSNLASALTALGGGLLSLLSLLGF